MTALQTHLRSIGTPALLLAISLLQACGGTPAVTPPPVEPITGPIQLPGDTAAQLELPRSSFADAFSTADSALAQGDWMSAAATLSPLQQTELTRNDSDYLQYLLARIDYRRGEQDAAASRLAQLDHPGLHPGISYRVLNFERHLLGLQRRYLARARLGVRVMAMAPEPDRAAVKRTIWRDLKRCTPRQLEQAREQANDAQWRGWLELASINNASTLALGEELSRWQEDYPEHPAAAPLPGGLEFLLEPLSPPGTVALVLPLSGRLAPAGKAVRDGYLASYYHARKSGEAPTELMVIDSDLYADATQAYHDAVIRGASLVIGPLSKNAVTDLAAQPDRPVPVIALNRIEPPATPAQTALVQLSLAPEDEARQLADTAFGQGARRVLILRPAGAWGDKIEGAFEQQWQALGGTLVPGVNYADKDEYSTRVKTSLGIAASEQRRRKLSDMLASPVEFTARRRQDIDAVIMLSSTPEEARALKPLLAFHYAGDLPVYATSGVHGGRTDARDRDLDGTRILELPWLLGSDPQLQKTLDDSNSHRFSRLIALGTDAYTLQTHLARLQAGPDALITGNTGLLSLNPGLQIERELPAAVFDGSRLRPL